MRAAGGPLSGPRRTTTRVRELLRLGPLSRAISHAQRSKRAARERAGARLRAARARCQKGWSTPTTTSSSPRWRARAWHLATLFQLGRLLDRLPDELWHHVMSFAIQRPDYELPPTDARVDYSSTSLSISGRRRILCLSCVEMRSRAAAQAAALTQQRAAEVLR